MAKSDAWLQKVEKKLRIAKEEGQISEDVIELLRELKIHHSELEAQNKELKNSQEELSGLLHKYHSLYDEAPVGYFSLNNEGIISKVNIKGIKLLGVQKKEIIGHGFSHFIHKEDEEKYFFALFESIAGNNQKLEIRLKGNNDYFYVFMEIMPLYDDDETYRIIIIDITEHKKTEDTLKEDQERYNTLFESMTEAFMMGEIILKKEKPYDFKYITINRAAASGYGMKPDQVKNKSFRELFPDIEPPSLKEIGEAVLKNKVIKNMEMQSPITGNWLEIDIYPQKENIFAVFTRTINERKKAELELLKKDAELERAQHIAHIGSYYWDLITDEVKWSDESYRLLGMTPGEENPSYELFIDFVVPEDRDSVNGAVMKGIELGKNFSFTYNVIGKDGAHRIILSENEVIKDESGKAIQLYGINQDITEIKKAEDALKESEEKFRVLAESSPAAILVYRDNKIIYLNPAAQSILGYSKEKLTDMDFLNIISPEYREIVKKKTQKRMEGYDVLDTYEVKMITENGQEKWLEISSNLIQYEGQPAGIVISSDITDRKRMEKALKKSEEKSRLLIKYAPSMIYEIDFRGPKLISVNDVMCKTLSYTREELLSMDPFDLLVDESKNIFQERINKYLAGEEITDTLEYTGKTKDGRIVYGLLNMTFTYENGNPVGAVVVAQDITERKKAEIAIKRSEEWFRTVVDTSPGLLVILDANGKISYVSPNAEKMTGYTSQEIIENEIWFVHPYYKTQLQRLFENALKTKVGDRNIEFESVKKNGEVWWTELSSKPIYDENGEFNGFVAQLFDITKRKKAEMELNKAYMYNRGLIETSLDPMVFIGSDGKIIDSNRATERITGYSREDIIGSDFSNYFVDPKQAKKGYIKAFKDGYVRDYDLEIKNKNGHIIPVSYNASTYKDENDEIVGVFAAARDMTEIRKTQKALKSEHDLLQAIIDTIPVMITIFDPFKMKFQVNKELERVTGWTNEDAQNKDLMEEVYPDPEYREKLLEYVYSLEPGFRDFKMVAKDGTVIDTTWASVRIPDGRYVGIALDIRERKKTLEALKESEEKFRALADSSPAAIGVYQNNKIVYVNPASESILGYSKDELFNMDWIDIAHPDYKKIAKDAIKARMTGSKENAYNELKIITKEGEEKWLDVSSNIIQYEGSPAAILIGTDITERKIMEEAVKNARDNLEITVKERTKELEEAYNALRESEAHLRIAMDMAKIVSWEYDIESDMFTFNDDFYALYGTTAEKEGGKKMNSEEYARRFIPPEESHLVGEEIAKAIETDDPNFKENIEHSIIRADGEKRYINVRFGVIKNEKGKTIRTYGSNQDITERKDAEKALKESEEIFRELLRKSFDAWAIHSEGILLAANDSAAKILGGKIEDFIGNPVINVVHPDYKKDVEKKTLRMYKEGGSEPLFEEKFIKLDGSVIDVEAVATTLNYKGKPAVHIVFRDITERKMAEEQLKETIRELERSNKELQSFAYITSHDLQEPLRTLGNYAGLLKMRYEGQLDEDADDFLDFMSIASIRMKDMIQGLLEYSRVGTKGEEFKKFNSEDALNAALSNLKSAIEDCDAKITNDSLPFIKADKSQIERIFQNLIGNALKFRRKGINPKIHISAKKEDHEYVFSVSDNGIGLEEEYSDKIFEVFKRLHAIGKYRGAGIGLAIVKRIIDRHGGYIWVESELGAGSTFYFTIPNGSYSNSSLNP